MYDRTCFDSGCTTPDFHNLRVIVALRLSLVIMSRVTVVKKPILVLRTALLKSRCRRRLLTGRLQPY
jgi:hypothetical protein